MQNDVDRKYSVILVPFFSILCTIATLISSNLIRHRNYEGYSTGYYSQDHFQFMLVSFSVAAIGLGIVELMLAFKYRHIASGGFAFVTGWLCLLIAVPMILFSWFSTSFGL